MSISDKEAKILVAKDKEKAKALYLSSCNRDAVFKNPLAEIKRQRKEFKKRFGVWPNCLSARGDIVKLLPKRKKGMGTDELMADKILGMVTCSIAELQGMSILSVSLINWGVGYHSDDQIFQS